MRRSILTVVAGATTIVTAAGAQTPAPPPHPPEPRPHVAPPPPPPPRPHVLRERIRVRLDSAWRDRATLGMSVAPTGSLRDTIGVFITRVAPGGPAERAGIVEGDRIAAVDGRSLRLDPGDAGDPYTAGVPAHRLRRLVGGLEPGSQVRLRVFAGGRYRDVTVTTARFADVYKRDWAFPYAGAAMRDMLLPAMEMVGPAFLTELDRAIATIPPDLDERVARAVRAVPRDITIRIDTVAARRDEGGSRDGRHP